MRFDRNLQISVDQMVGEMSADSQGYMSDASCAGGEW